MAVEITIDHMSDAPTPTIVFADDHVIELDARLVQRPQQEGGIARIILDDEQADVLRHVLPSTLRACWSGGQGLPAASNE